ncbi:carbohydrate ABC transporter permease [Streptococcus suis]|uniref:carbohydrate ABC transporter permease n=1 Tax=Streptococcus suis TaxID=1307 RepID=UPI002FCACAAF
MKKKKQITSVSIHSFSKKTDLFFSSLLGIFALSCTLPFIFVIIISMTDETSLAINGYSFWPEQWSLAGYEYLFQLKDQILQALFITFFVTIVGTSLNVFFTVLYAYAISRNSFRYRRFFTLMALFTALAFWNDWYNALLYIQSDNLFPLQYLLMKIQANIQYLSENAAAAAAMSSEVAGALPKEATRMAIVVVSTLPIACLYPFFQRYFVKGLTIGGVKE